MSPNCSALASRPSVLTVTWKADEVSGCCPTEPAATCTFCSRSAATTSLAVSPRVATRDGSSQTRMEYSPAPQTSTSFTPGRRASSSRTWRMAKFDR